MGRMETRLLLLDYDGVIVDSMPAKAQAMAQAFAPYTADGAAVADGFRRHAGSGREMVFDHIWRHVTGGALADDARTHIEADYLGRMDSINAAVDLFPGVHDFIATQSAKRTVAVVTGVPQAEAERQLARLGLRAFFAAVRSATRRTPKHMLMRDLLAAHAVPPSAALFAGDSLTDMTEAAQAEVPFVGIGDDPAFFASGASVAVAPRLPEIAPLLDG